MTELEQLSVNVQRQIDAQNARIDNVAVKVDMIINELQQQREDIRRAQENHAADMKEIRNEIKDTLRHIQGLTIAAMVGIVAIAGATWAFMWSSTRNETPPQNPPTQTAQAAKYQQNQPSE